MKKSRRLSVLEVRTAYELTMNQRPPFIHRPRWTVNEQEVERSFQKVPFGIICILLWKDSILVVQHAPTKGRTFLSCHHHYWIVVVVVRYDDDIPCRALLICLDSKSTKCTAPWCQTWLHTPRKARRTGGRTQGCCSTPFWPAFSSRFVWSFGVSIVVVWSLLRSWWHHRRRWRRTWCCCCCCW